MHRVSIAALFVAVTVSGCVSPEHKAEEARFNQAVMSMPKADRLECDMVMAMRPHPRGENFLETVDQDYRIKEQCLKVKLYRAGYLD